MASRPSVWVSRELCRSYLLHISSLQFDTTQEYGFGGFHLHNCLPTSWLKKEEPGRRNPSGPTSQWSAEPLPASVDPSHDRPMGRLPEFSVLLLTD